MNTVTDREIDLLAERIWREFEYHRLNAEAAELRKYARRRKAKAAA